jgi:hypothetical protein
MSWIPLVGSGLGSMVGGHLSDLLSRQRNDGLSFGRAGRPIVAGVSALVSTPFVVLALYASYPGCFLYFIPSGFVSLRPRPRYSSSSLLFVLLFISLPCSLSLSRQTGEMYIGASLALLSDVTPTDLIVPSVALFMFIITLIGGNAPLLVPLVLSLRPITHHTFSFQAAPPAGSPLSESSILYSVTRRSGDDLQAALVILFVILYLLSSLLYFLCAYSLWGTSSSPSSSFSDASYQPLESGMKAAGGDLLEDE